MPSNHLILCCLLLSYLKSFPASGSLSMSQFFISGGQSIGISASTSVLAKNIQGKKKKEYSGLISFRIDWFDLLPVQGTLKSLHLQHSSTQFNTVRRPVFFMVQLSHPYMTTGKKTAFTRWTFVGRLMSLLHNMLFRVVITFLPRSKHLLISWLHSHICSDFGAPKR